MEADSKTLLASSSHDSEGIPKTSFAASINNALCGNTPHDSGLGESRSSESPDSQMYIYEKQSMEPYHKMIEKNSISNSLEIRLQTKNENINTSSIHHNRKWVNDSTHRTNCQPFSRIDLAPPNHTRNGPVQCSPMLAPRARKEIIPNCTKR